MDRVTLDLPDDLSDLLRDAVETGGYSSESAVVIAALHAWDDRRYDTPEAVARLRTLVQEGLASGPSEPLDMAEIRREAREGFERSGS